MCAVVSHNKKHFFFYSIATTKSPVKQCLMPDWFKDGICDDQNNVESCEFDGGDCCGGDINTCTECICHEEDKEKITEPKCGKGTNFLGILSPTLWNS